MRDGPTATPRQWRVLTLPPPIAGAVVLGGVDCLVQTARYRGPRQSPILIAQAGRPRKMNPAEREYWSRHLRCSGRDVQTVTDWGAHACPTKPTRRSKASPGTGRCANSGSSPMTMASPRSGR